MTRRDSDSVTESADMYVQWDAIRCDIKYSDGMTMRTPGSVYTKTKKKRREIRDIHQADRTRPYYPKPWTTAQLACKYGYTARMQFTKYTGIEGSRAALVSNGYGLRSFETRTYALIGKVILVRVIKALLGTRLVALLVIPDADVSVDDDEQSRHGGRDDHHDKAGDVAWCVFLLEDHGADEVAYTD